MLADFSGTWKLDTAATRIKDGKLASELAKLTISQKDSSISLAKPDSPAVECSTSGKDCSTKAAKVSFWLDGPKLVEM